MTDARAPASTRTSRTVKAPREALYRAFTDPAAFTVWLSPEGVKSMTFDSVDPDYSGEMTMVVTFEDRDDGTEVTISFEGIPPGIRPEDNDAGTRSSLEKLARYTE